MREVAWVVFDEIHYMRDKGNVLMTSFFLQSLINSCDLKNQEALNVIVYLDIYIKITKN